MSATPILDRERAFPKRRGPRWRNVAIGAILGIALEVGLAYRVIPEGYSALEILGSFVVCLYLVVLVHELGHAIVGAALGFELRGLAVGPFFLHRLAHGWGLRFSPWLIAGGGLATVAPRSTENLRGKFIRFALGGPVATAIFIVVCVLYPGGFWRTMLLVVNVVAAATSFIPYTIGEQPTDAKVVWIQRTMWCSST
jgi:hypothetical protein